MSHVKKAQAYTHWPTGCPNRARMKDPSLHEPSKKVLQMKTWAYQACTPNQEIFRVFTPKAIVQASAFPCLLLFFNFTD